MLGELEVERADVAAPSARDLDHPVALPVDDSRMVLRDVDVTTAEHARLSLRVRVDDGGRADDDRVRRVASLGALRGRDEVVGFGAPCASLRRPAPSHEEFAQDEPREQRKRPPEHREEQESRLVVSVHVPARSRVRWAAGVVPVHRLNARVKFAVSE
jgi:hypothetical protein